MDFISTRGGDAVGIDVALVAGLAPDGGLYIPRTIPAATLTHPGPTLADTAQQLLAPYFAGSRLRQELPRICRSAFDFPAPLRELAGEGDHLLELFHGPTAAFKDYAARFLAQCLAGLREDDGQPPTTILVATSGDTGAAVGAAFHNRPGFRVAILYPDGRVSPRQAHGLACFGGNVRCFRVEGSFDDCQAIVKQVLGDAALRARLPLGSANSISLGRLLPQMAYYAHTALAYRQQHGQALNFIVPTGNLGNALACWLARRMGLPIGEIVLGCNANDVLPRFFAGGDYAPSAGVATLANAMDVGAPSNFERLRALHADDGQVRASMRAIGVDDATIGGTIASAPTRHGVVPCPHTAVGLHVLETLRAQGDRRPWAVVATAHAAKFDTVVEPRVGHTVVPPPGLARWLSRPAHAEAMPADASWLREQLMNWDETRGDMPSRHETGAFRCV
ncbi:threonine synthase [Agrilutibacter solisilvae]|uniref:Threonine synthase n=1 Tax=Agrilutibacter solisilvae TaxID=2763317 RepID=A0A975AT01_9GAMM|nr:threonine synthase [Lysobacter solisilvae]QSX79504.1 threonine synthase [Lysobacter solisilvae]